MTQPPVPSQPRKIIGVISFMNAGGAHEALLRLARQMRARGHQMEVWFLYEQNPIHAAEPFIKVFFHKKSLSPFEYIAAFLRLISALRSARPDAVVGFLPLGAVFGLTAAWLVGVPLRIASQRSPGTTFGRVMRALDRAAGASPIYSRIICVSNAVKQSFAGYPKAYWNKLSVVHNGIEWTPSAMTRAQARKAFGLPKDAFIFAAVGRTQPQKNYPVLISALAKVSGVIMVVAGDGYLRPELEAQATALGVADRVVFLGAIKREACRDLLRAADAFVQSSLFEGQSNAVLEAMLEGLPIAVSDIPEQRETVVDDETGEIGGLLAPVHDVDAWAETLLSIRDDAALRDRLSKTALGLVARRFTLEKMIDGFEAAIVAGPKR